MKTHSEANKVNKHTAAGFGMKAATDAVDSVAFHSVRIPVCPIAHSLCCGLNGTSGHPGKGIESCGSRNPLQPAVMG